MASLSTISTRLAIACLVVFAALAAASEAPAATAPAAKPPGSHVAIVFLPGPPVGNTGPSMIKRLSYRKQLALGFVSATQGAYRPPQVLLDVSAGARVALSLYDDELPSGIRLEVNNANAGRIAQWPAILERADTVPADIDPGTLGGALRAAGRRAVYLGTRAGRNLEAIVAADRDGGISPVVFSQPREVTQAALALWRTQDLLVADLPGGTPGYQALDTLLAARQGNDVLIVIQKPPDVARRLLAIGAAGLGGGSALQSDSTRRPGLVTTTDIAPTVLDRVGVPVPGQVQGQPIEATNDRTVKQISNLRGRITQVGPRRWKVTLGGLALAVLAIALIGWRSREPWLKRLGRGALIAACWLPGVLLVSGAFSTSKSGETLMIAAACTVLTLASQAIVPWPRTPLLPAAATIAGHLLDLAFGSGLTIRSLLGPNPILGARFYGIGNELEVTLAVIALIGIGAAVARSEQRTRVWSFVLAGGLLTLLLSWGRLGADVGASLTLGAGAAAGAVASLEGASTRRRIAIVLLAPALALGALAAVDILTGGDSHFTRSVLRAGGAHELGDVFQRKLESSYGSLSRGIIPLLSLAAIVGLVFGLRARKRLLAPIDGYPGLQAGIYAALTAVVAGALTNDSGPVILLIGTVYLGLAVGYVASGSPARAAPAGIGLSNAGTAN